jgi:hypothetical protein
MVVRRHRDVSGVEEPVDVRAEEQAVRHIVRAFVRVRPDVGRLEDRERVLAAHGAGAAIGARDGDAERALSEAGANELRLAVARRVRLACRGDEGQRRRACSAFAALLPDPPAFPFGKVIPGPGDDVRSPVPRLLDPIAIVEEDGRRDHDAADAVRGATGLARVAADSPRHRGEARGAVLLAERLPGELRRRGLVPGEDPEPADRVVRRLELEEERRPGRRVESMRRGLPEVHLFERLARAQEGEPVVVGGRDVAAHGRILAHARGRRPQSRVVGLTAGAEPPLWNELRVTTSTSVGCLERCVE